MAAPPRDRRGGAPAALRWALVGLCVFGLVMMVGIAGAYPPPNPLYGLGEGVGFCLLAALGVYVWWFGPYGEARSSGRRIGLAAGLIGGLIWIAEIAYNNFVSARVKTDDLVELARTRDTVDDLLWAVVALVLLAGGVAAARKAGRWRDGLVAGLWGGVVSGLIACLMGLALVAFWMPALVADPLNAREFAGQRTAMSIERYFAAETMAGAILHLVVLGVVMGALLGALGGLAGFARRPRGTGR